MTPEATYLTHLIHCYISGEQIRPLPANLNLDAFQDLMTAHNILPTLAPTLLHANLPTSFTQMLTESIRLAEQTNIIMLLELTRFLDKLESAGCHTIVLKGAGLVQTIYHSIGDRIFADLDILVPLAKVEEAQMILEDLGYTAAKTAASIEYYTKYHFHQIMRSPLGITVEIHWNLTPPNSYYQFNLDRLIARAQIIDTPNGPIYIPSWTDQLLHCVYQNIGDGFSGLRRVIDAALILPLIKDQEKLAAEAIEQNLASGLWAVLYLVQGLTGTLVPNSLIERIQPPNLAAKCFESLELLEHCLQQSGSKKILLNELTDWLCLPGRKAATHEIWHYIFPRSEDYIYYERDLGTSPSIPRRLLLSSRHLFAFLGLAAQLSYSLLTKNPKKETP